MNNEQQAAERMRVKQILHRAKQDIDKIFMRVEQELCADMAEPAPIFGEIERHFGRLLTGAELETVRDWMDRYQPDLIAVALNEAAIKNIQNVRYIDVILLNWEKQGITSPQAAIEHSQKFRQRASPRQESIQPIQESQPKVPFYNWLEERE